MALGRGKAARASIIIGTVRRAEAHRRARPHARQAIKRRLAAISPDAPCLAGSAVLIVRTAVGNGPITVPLAQFSEREKPAGEGSFLRPREVRSGSIASLRQPPRNVGSAYKRGNARPPFTALTREARLRESGQNQETPMTRSTAMKWRLKRSTRPRLDPTARAASRNRTPRSAGPS